MSTIGSFGLNANPLLNQLTGRDPREGSQQLIRPMTPSLSSGQGSGGQTAASPQQSPLLDALQQGPKDQDFEPTSTPGPRPENLMGNILEPLSGYNPFQFWANPIQESVPWARSTGGQQARPAQAPGGSLRDSLPANPLNTGPRWDAYRNVFRNLGNLGAPPAP